jgi:hypothetical protein
MKQKFKSALAILFAVALCLAFDLLFQGQQAGAQADGKQIIRCDLAAGLQTTIVLNAALLAFRKKIIPLRMFATAWKRDQAPLSAGKTMSVPYYPLEAVASKDFAGSYDFTGSGPDVETRDVTINKRKYQPLICTSEELSRYNFNPEKLGEMKGNRLANDVVTDVLSLVTAANFGAAVFTGAAGTFDADDVADIQLACDEANWPAEMRSLLLKSSYNTSLVKDNAIQAEYASGTTDPLYEGRIPRLSGFDVFPSNEIPANGENLVGMAIYPSALLVGFAPIPPADSVRKNLTAYEVVEDPETGIYIEYRAWGDPDSDSHKEVIEVNYGYAKGEGAAIKRLISA